MRDGTEPVGRLKVIAPLGSRESSSTFTRKRVTGFGRPTQTLSMILGQRLSRTEGLTSSSGTRLPTSGSGAFFYWVSAPAEMIGRASSESLIRRLCKLSGSRSYRLQRNCDSLPCHSTSRIAQLGWMRHLEAESSLIAFG